MLLRKRRKSAHMRYDQYNLPTHTLSLLGSGGEVGPSIDRCVKYCQIMWPSAFHRSYE